MRADEIHPRHRKFSEKEIQEWIGALARAEAAAATVKGSRLKWYAVDYRLSADFDDDLPVNSDERRRALTRIIESRSPEERHTSTSGWLMKLHIPDAALVRNLLTGPLDRGVDYLSACELVPGKCATFGDAELKSD